MILEYGLREDVTTITAPEFVNRTRVKKFESDDKQVVKKKNEQKGLDR